MLALGNESEYEQDLTTAARGNHLPAILPAQQSVREQLELSSCSSPGMELTLELESPAQHSLTAVMAPCSGACGG